jgi:hypothetical protein
MSNKKKPKKLRTPNVPMRTAGAASSTAPAQARGGGQEVASQPRFARAVPAATQANFDYTYVKKDLSRIGVLAGSFIVILVILSFFIK